MIYLFSLFSLDGILGPLVYRPGKLAFDDNYIDRISSYYTVSILLFFEIYVTTVEYVGEPVYCWSPPELNPNEIKYINYLCWVANTYRLPLELTLPSNYQLREDVSDEITYYKWVPMMLFLMALLFFLPRFVFKALAEKSGVEVKKMCILGKMSMDVLIEHREQRLRYIAAYLDLFCSGVNKYQAGICSSAREKIGMYFSMGCGRHYGNYFITLNIFVRLLYFLNAFGQLFLLNEFLGNKFYLYGYESIAAFVDGNDWTISPRFPRVTHCDIEIRQITNIQRWTLQCVIPINLYNEKIFLFMWFWCVLLSVLSGFNLCMTIAIGVLPQMRETFIKKHLNMKNMLDQKQKRRHNRICEKFIHEHLCQDGVYVLKQIAYNCNTVVTGDVIMYMFYRFLNRQKRKGDKNILSYFPPEPKEVFPTGGGVGGVGGGGGGGRGGGGKKKKR